MNRDDESPLNSIFVLILYFSSLLPKSNPLEGEGEKSVIMIYPS